MRRPSDSPGQWHSIWPAASEGWKHTQGPWLLNHTPGETLCRWVIVSPQNEEIRGEPYGWVGGGLVGSRKHGDVQVSIPTVTVQVTPDHVPQGVVEPLYQPIGTRVVRGGSGLSYLLQLADLLEKVALKDTTLVRVKLHNLVGNSSGLLVCQGKSLHPAGEVLHYYQNIPIPTEQLRKRPHDVHCHTVHGCTHSEICKGCPEFTVSPLHPG